VLGTRVEQLLTEYADSVDFCAPYVAFADAQTYLPGIAAKRGISSEVVESGLESLRALVEEVPEEVTASVQAAALQLIGRRDPDDWPIVAAALVLDCPIWTEDRDFFGMGIPTWTSDLVDVHLRREPS
jgi:predicted nucleic acid-binding protein